MNVETTELKAVEVAAQSDACADILALSFDDLDLVAGGQVIGLGF